MNTKQISYALELFRTLSFSQVAEKLGITQPALSKQIMSLEHELGVKLFDRSTTPLTVTAAGESFFREAEKLLTQEDLIKKMMEEFSKGKRGSLTVGISPFRSLYLIPEVAKKFKEKYPDIQLILREASSDVLKREAAEGKYDLAVINLPVDETALDVTLIEADILVLAVPENLCKNLPESKTDALPKISLGDCKDIPFVTVGQTQEMRRLFDKGCAAAGVAPEIAVEVVGLSTAFAMCKAGVGATLLPLQFIKSAYKGDGVSLYLLKHNLHTRQPAIVTKKGQYISEYAKYFIKLLSE